MKIKKKIGGGSGQGDVTPTKLLSQNIFKESTGGGGGQDGCERRIKVFVKIQKKFDFFWGGGAGRGGGAGSGGRCRSGRGGRGGEGGQVWGVRVDVNSEVKFL